MRRQALKTISITLALSGVIGSGIYLVLSGDTSTVEAKALAHHSDVPASTGDNAPNIELQVPSTQNVEEDLAAIRSLWGKSIRPSESELAFNSNMKASELLPLLQAYHAQGDVTAAFYISQVIDMCRSVAIMAERLQQEAKERRTDSYSHIIKGSTIRAKQFLMRQDYCQHLPTEATESEVKKYLQEAVDNRVGVAVIRSKQISEKIDPITADFITNKKRESLYLEALQDAEHARTPAAMLETAFQLTLIAPGKTNEIIAELIVAACASHLDCNAETREEMIWLCNLSNCREGDDYLSLAVGLSGKKDPSELSRAAMELVAGVLDDEDYLRKRLIKQFSHFTEKHGI